MTDWSEEKVDVTMEDSDDNWYGVELTNLSPGTAYRVKVASKNKEGYSKFSKVHTFITPNAGSLYLII